MPSSRVWKLAAAAAGGLIVLGVAPPLVNANRLEHRIATSMSESLGRPVRLDGVSFHVLPLPGFTLSNLVVSEDPAFGYEPVIRADSVEAELRISSLWRRQVEFSTVRFIQPSLNLVRNPAGRWNLEDILMQASRATTAPTGQHRPGPAPRFPYIEATGGRVNLKLGLEKVPFSLGDADFALWLDTPEMWNVRLKATPIRTDNSVQNTGLLRVEGSLGRGRSAAEVPLTLEARWTEAPLGQASQLLTADDSGWRGTLNATTRITGRLGEAQLDGQLHLRDVRRDAFVPAQTMDLDVHCTAGGQLTHLTLQGVHCAAPVDDAPPIEATAPTLDLQRPLQAAATAELKTVPLHWLLGWGAVLSHRIDPRLAKAGTLDGEVRWAGSPAKTQEGSSPLTGELRMTLPPLPAAQADAMAKPADTVLVWRLDSEASPSAVRREAKTFAPVLHLAPTAVKTGASTTLTLGADVSPTKYTLTADGTATPAQWTGAIRVLPQLGDDLARVLPATSPADTPVRLDATCQRVWGQPQSCVAAAAGAPVAPPHRH